MILSKIIRFVRKAIADNRLDRYEEDFVSHNKNIWRSCVPTKQESEILIEVNNMSTSIIAFSYLANVLAMIHNAVIKGYILGDCSVRAKIFQYGIKRIYKSFNVHDFMYYKLSHSQEEELQSRYHNVLLQVRTKKGVEDLTLEGLWIGDLLYDSHCLRYMVPTVELDDDQFHSSLKDAIGSYIYWRDYFNEHDVKSVMITHTVYVYSGVITRLAIKRGISVYQISATHLYFLNENNLWAYNDFIYYPEKFHELSEDEQKKGLEEAKERINLRFSGEVGVDMHYSTKSAYGNKHNKKVLKESGRIKVLVATHCFYDSPHPYGVNLFPDFYEWLYFLGRISEKTDYDWYIKTHPDFLPGNIPIIEEFIRKYPRFILIPSHTSHLQLIEEGINYGLTVYGTIGFEYAALGIPVINASLCNPHIRYNFNTHPRTIEEYEKILLNLSAQKMEININEVYEYYYMAFINNNTNNWLFQDYEGFVKSIGGYVNQFSPISYEVFVKKFTTKRHEETLRSLKEFVDSKEYRFHG